MVILSLLLFFTSLLLIVLVLVQDSKGGAMGSTFGGGGSNSLLGSTGASNFFEKLTTAVAAVFFLLALWLTITVMNSTESVVQDYQPAMGEVVDDATSQGGASENSEPTSDETPSNSSEPDPVESN